MSNTQPPGSAATSTSFSADARSSLFQALGLKPAPKAVDTNHVSISSAPLTPYGNATAEKTEPCVMRQHKEDRGNRGKRGNNRDNAAPPVDAPKTEERRNTGSAPRSSKASTRPAGRIVVVTEPEPGPFEHPFAVHTKPERPSVISGTTNNSNSKPASHGFDSIKVSSQAPTKPVQILQRPPEGRQNGRQRERTEPAPPTTAATARDIAPPAHISAPIAAPVVAEKAPNKPVPMLIQILTAAKAKSDQRRAESLAGTPGTAGAAGTSADTSPPPLPPQTSLAVPVSAPVVPSQAAAGRSRQKNTPASRVTTEAADATGEQVIPSIPVQQKRGDKKKTAADATASTTAAAADAPQPPKQAVSERKQREPRNNSRGDSNQGPTDSALNHSNRGIGVPIISTVSPAPTALAKVQDAHPVAGPFHQVDALTVKLDSSSALLDTFEYAPSPKVPTAEGYGSEGSDDLLLLEATRSGDLQHDEDYFGDLPSDESRSYSRADSVFSVTLEPAAAATASSPEPLLPSIGVPTNLKETPFRPLDAPLAPPPNLSQLSQPSQRNSRPVTPTASTPTSKPTAVTPTRLTPARNTPARSTPSRSTPGRCSPSSAASSPPTTEPSPARSALPVDEHREKILQHVRDHAVTIINGMTGCGKSTRIPVMILEDSRSLGADARVMVSQPRRIAASALKNRLATTLGDVVGLRLGHGKREETPNTRIWFVTTGYLVRLLAHKMHTFASYTHLVIDEIHERSLDCDLLCYLAKRLLHAFPHIKIVLMSATAHSAMFQAYFNTPHEPIFVGVRRFPLHEYFAEDLYPFLSNTAQKTLSRLLESTSRCNRRLIEEVVPDSIVKDQLAVAAALARSIGKPGGAVLIFVSGMADITELMEILNNNLQNNKRNDSVKTQILAVHSDIPHEQQLLAFLPTQPDETKIVIATNAAESSVTIPDVDHVICLGTSKMLTYSARHHTTQLVNSWVSKASATQRAGRTGRVRPGSVYHLYCRNLYECMHDYEVSEVHRQPMTEVALRLKSMLTSINAYKPTAGNSTASDEAGPANEDDDSDVEDAVGGAVSAPISAPLLPGVTAVLRALIEPPSLQSIEDALYTLYECGMLTSPFDGAHLTEIGALAADLPVDFMLGRFIGYAVLLGVPREAVIIAAALGNPRSPFRTPNLLVQTDTDEINSHCRQLFLSMSRLDRGLLSEPLMLVQAFIEYQQLRTDQDKYTWCREHCIVPTRMRQLNSVLNNLYATVYNNLTQTRTGKRGGGGRAAGGAGARKGSIEEDDHSYSESLASLHALTPRAVNALRLCMLWAFPHHVLKQKSVFASEEQMCTAELPQLAVNSAALNNFLQGHFYSSSAREFTAQRCEEVSVDWRLVAQGKRTYSADVLDRSFEGMLEAFLGLLSDLEAHVAWLTGSYTKPESVLIVYDRAVAEEKLKPYLIAIFGKDLVKMNSTVERVIVKAMVSHRSQLTKLNDVFQEERWKIFSWDIPGSGPASLVCANCIPNEKQIRHLFLGRDLTNRIASMDLSDYELAQRWHTWEYKSKIARSKLKIVFPEDLPTAYANGGYTPVVVAGAPVRLHRYDVIRNVPLGLRLMNFVRLNSNTDRLLRLTVPESAGDGGDDEGPSGGLDAYDHQYCRPYRQSASHSQDARRTGGNTAIAGSLKSPLNHNQSHNPHHSFHQGGYHGADLLPSALTNIKINTVNTEWIKLPPAGSDQRLFEEDLSLHDYRDQRADEPPHNEPRRITFPPYSLQRVSQHLGNEAVYCVAYSLMVLQQPSGEKVYRAEGATMLPVGSQWLSLALACVCRLDTKVTRNFKDGCQLSPQQCSLVERISDYLAQCSVRYCFQRPFNPLNSDLDDLFGAWVSSTNINSSGVSAAQDLDQQGFCLEDELESFMPLSHPSVSTGTTNRVPPPLSHSRSQSSQSLIHSTSQSHSLLQSPCPYQFQYGSGSPDEFGPAGLLLGMGGGSGERSSPLAPVSPARSSAWLSHSAAVRAAGPLAQRQLSNSRSGDAFDEY